MFHGIRELLELDAGYTGICRRLLNEAAASVGDEIIVVTRRGEYRGTLLMRYEMGAQDRIVLKLANGYNIGVKVWEDSRVIRIAKSTPPAFRPVHPLPALGELPKVAIVSTGGTIASRIDYRTGGVRPALSASDLLTVVPELSQIAQISTEVLMSIYSENMTAQHWTVIAEKVDELIRSGVDGVVIAHGTDTMGYTAAALSFALLKPPIPIVIVGSQRSSDRPSSDAAINLIAAVDFAGRSPVAEVCVCMHDGYSDEVISIHRGTRVVKLHTSSRSAFKSINSQPIAFWTPSGIRITSKGLNPRRGEGYSFSQFFDDRAILVK
ncbi:MAG: Glu-tRNA(Gln) amidotransferase subunit GatD, partial [Nitrososphaerota archaeon]